MGAALLGGALLRAWGLDFGLPHTLARPDEALLLHRALAIAGGELNPGFFSYPSLQLYLLAGVSGVYYLLGLLRGTFAGTDDLLLELLRDPSGFYLSGRLLTLAMGVGTIAITAWFAGRLGGIAAAAAAAVALAGAFLHVRDSHFMTVDIPATLWATASLAALTAYLQNGNRRWLWSGAALLGLAASTKYNAGLFLPALVIAAGSGAADRRQRLRHLGVAAGVAAVAFLVGSPFVLLDAPAFLRDFLFEWKHFGRGHTGADLGNGWWYHVTFSLRHGMGAPLLVAALASLGWLAARHRRVAGPLLAATLSYFAVAGAGESLFVRYILPLVPLLCTATGVGLAALARSRPLPAALLAALLVAPSTTEAIAHVRILARQDTRLQARAWIEARVPGGARIALAGSAYGLPQLTPTTSWLERRLVELRREGAAARRLAAAARLPGYPPAPAYDLLVLRPDAEPAGAPAGAAPAGRTERPPETLAALRQLGVDWLVTQVHPLAYARVPQVLADDLQLLTPAAAFAPGPDRALHAAVFDPLDAYFAPLVGAGGLDRPGPHLRIYDLRH